MLSVCLLLIFLQTQAIPIKFALTKWECGRFRSGLCCTTGQCLHGYIRVLAQAHDFLGRMHDESEEMYGYLCQWLSCSLCISLKTKPHKICETISFAITVLLFQLLFFFFLFLISANDWYSYLCFYLRVFSLVLLSTGVTAALSFWRNLWHETRSHRSLVHLLHLPLPLSS